MSLKPLENYIGGTWIQASTADSVARRNPATGELLARVPRSGTADVDRAVAVAREAFLTWSQVPAVQRTRPLFKLRNLVEKRAEDLARVITREHGKTLDESRGEVRRGLENLERACAIPEAMMGEAFEDVAAGLDCETLRRPIGVFAAITPSSFPAMVPLWFWPYAVAAGNAFIVKPSEMVPLSQQLLFELVHDAGFPAGVVNLVHGEAQAAEELLEHAGIDGVSFVGSTPLARQVYRRAAAAGKRVQALGGARSHMVVMPDAVIDRTASALVESCFGCAGQRCLAGSVVVAVGEVHDRLAAALVAEARRIVVGNGLDRGVTMGPVISGRALDRISSLIHLAEQDGARLLLDGRGVEIEGHPGGSFLGPTIVSGVTDEMALARSEVFGPVLVLRRAASLESALEMIRRSPYAAAGSIFTASGKSAREFRRAAGVSMLGVNVGVAAPTAFFPHGGARESFFGDLKAHGKDALRFFTDQKVVISRWF